MSNVLLYFLIPVGLAATLIILGIGIYSLARGGEFSDKHSNKLMRMRVTAQAVTIGLLMLFVFLIGQGNG